MNWPMSMAALVWHPPLSPAWVWFIGGLLAILAARSYWATPTTRSLLAGAALVLRLIVIAALVLFLHGPERSVAPASVQPRLADLAVMVDASESMHTRDCGQASRLTHLLDRWLAPAQRHALATRFQVRWIRFDHNANNTSIDALAQSPTSDGPGAETRLVQSLTDVIGRMGGDDAGGDLVLLSDGHDTTDEPIDAAIRLAQARRVRVHTACFGESHQPANVAVELTPPVRPVAVGGRADLGVTLRPVGLPDAVLTIRHHQPGGGAVERREPVNRRDVIDLWLPLEITHGGDQAHAVTVEWPGEAGGIARAEASALIRTTDQRLRVAMVESSPDWDSRFLADALRRDAGVTLTVISAWRRDGVANVIHAPLSDDVPDGKSPREGFDDWRTYDAVILMGDPSAVIDPAGAARLVSFVQEHGGAVLWVAGPSAAPASADQRASLARLRPIDLFLSRDGAAEWESVARMRLTGTRRGISWLGLGSDSAGIAAVLALPSEARWIHLGATKPAAGPLLALERADRAPVVWSMPSGAGMVGAVTVRGLWRWRLSPDQTPDRRDLYDMFWGHLIRHLVYHGDWEPGSPLRLEVAAANLDLGAEQRVDVTARLATADMPAPALSLVDPGGRARSLTLAPFGDKPGRWSATVQPDVPGMHRVVLESPIKAAIRLERGFVVVDRRRERVDVAARPALMDDLARQTGGVTLRHEDAAHWPDRIGTPASATDGRGGRPEAIPAWPQPAALLGVLVALVGEWILRRRMEWG